MLERNKKKFTLTIGSNKEGICEEDLENMAVWLENEGNEAPNGFKFHIFPIEEKSEVKKSE